MKILTVFVPEKYIEFLEMLVNDGRFPNRSEAIRVAIRDLIKTEYLIERRTREDAPTSEPEEALLPAT